MQVLLEPHKEDCVFDVNIKVVLKSLIDLNYLIRAIEMRT